MSTKIIAKKLFLKFKKIFPLPQKDKNYNYSILLVIYGLKPLCIGVGRTTHKHTFGVVVVMMDDGVGLLEKINN
mgnify:CR=1 FL=1